MKKIIITLVFLLVASFAFQGCEKEKQIKKTENITSANPQQNNLADDIDIDAYETYISELSEATGIDIYEASTYESVCKAAKRQEQILDFAEYNDTKGALTEETVNRIKNLNNAIQEAYEQGNESLAWSLFDELCSICRNIDGFIFSTDENGWEVVTYDPSQDPVLVPVFQMQAIQTEITDIENELYDRNPSYKNLPADTKNELVKATLYVNLTQKNFKEQYDPEACKKSAHRSCAFDLSLATVLYTVAAAGCTGTAFAVGLCEAGAYAAYMTSVATTVQLYHARIQLCELQGHY